jgi:hypothetical protein
LGLFHKGRHEAGRPTRIDDDVIVHEGHELGSGVFDAVVSSQRAASARLQNILDARLPVCPAGDEVGGIWAREDVVYDDDSYLLVAAGEDRINALGKPVGAVVGRDNHVQRRAGAV